MTKTTRIVLVCLSAALLLTFSFVYAVESSQKSHRINSTQTISYLEHSEAIKVTNSCGKDMFIPANTSAEWADFNNSAPSCATLDGDFIECAAATGTVCGGSVVQEFNAGGATYSNCLAASSDYDDGTCLVATGGDFDCRLYDGTVGGSGSTSGSCTDYD